MLDTSAMIPQPDAVRRGAGADDVLIAGRRLGRALFGAVLLLGAVLLVVGAITRRPWDALRDGPSSPEILALTWLAALTAYVMGRVVGSLRTKLRRLPIDDALLFPSLALPMAGLSLLVPLSIHALVGLAGGESSGFEDWVRWSMMIVGHVHLALAGLAVRAAWSMARGEQHLSGFAILFIVTGVACVPGVIFLAIPPILVLATGTTFVPLMVWRMSNLADDEIMKTTHAT